MGAFPFAAFVRELEFEQPHELIAVEVGRGIEF